MANKRPFDKMDGGTTNPSIGIGGGESSCNNTNKMFPARSNDFSERTWWMVDIHDSNGTTQGATPLVVRCMRVYGWDLEKTRKILSAYKQFLALKELYKDWNASIISPSLLVDQMWHQHILDVVNYTHDMILLCGNVVGHNPDGALDTERKAKRDTTTRDALETYFANQYDKEIWGIKEGEKSSEHEEGECSILKRQISEAFDGSNVDLTPTLLSKLSSLYTSLPLHNPYRLLEEWKKYSKTKKIDILNDETFEGFSKSLSGLQQINIYASDLSHRSPKDYFRFKVKRKTKMREIFHAVSLMKGHEVAGLRFYFDGENIDPEYTVNDLMLNDGDKIDVFLAQGGC